MFSFPSYISFFSGVGKMSTLTVIVMRISKQKTRERDNDYGCEVNVNAINADKNSLLLLNEIERKPS